MEKSILSMLILMVTLLSCSWSATAVQLCGNCGLTPVPFPLSTGPDCGNQQYKLRCSLGKLWFDALNGSSYLIASINPVLRRIVIRPASLANETCISSDFHSQGIQLNQNLPFSITNSNTILLLNCKNEILHLKPPIDCATGSICHNYIQGNAAACASAPVCCTFETSTGLQSAYMIKVYEGGCAAYQSFVNLDVKEVGMIKKWPEPGVEIEWAFPKEPICKIPVDCKDLLYSKCLPDPISLGQKRCFCDAGFNWDPINGLCQNLKCVPGKVCKKRKKKTVVFAGAAVGAVAVLVMVLACLDDKRQNRPSMKEVADEIEYIISIAAGKIEALKAIGVTEVVLAINYQPEVMLNFLKEYEKKLAIKITCSQETEPLGTAGPLALARDKLIDDSGAPFFVLNSDVISEYPLKQMIEFHKGHGGEASIMVTKVDEPSKYGVVLLEETSGKVEKFVEKPKIFVGNKINAGIYLLNPSVLDRIELRPTSIEKEVFPKIAAENKLFAMVLPGFWMDIGQPKDYVTGLRLYLDSLRKMSSPKLATGPNIVGNVLVDESAVIGEGCLIGPDVAIGPGCIIDSGVRLSRCTVMRGVRIKKHACISSSIIGWHSTVGRWARIENMTILGEDVHVGDEVYSNGGVVLPHKEIKSSILKPEIVM
ncbi:hypothetical protein D5086_012555 [Populus alba]|uniref:Uncharacterized protein n=1 Tax=Populus alba TaxID=43335 RepID=A0ACC4C316_POPAL